MATRITDKDLNNRCDYLNKLTGSPAAPYAPWVEGQPNTQRAQVGNFHISGAYGGVQLHRISNTGGGVSTPLNTGYVTKRELYEALSAFIAGIELERRAK